MSSGWRDSFKAFRKEEFTSFRRILDSLSVRTGWLKTEESLARGPEGLGWSWRFLKKRLVDRGAPFIVTVISLYSYKR